MPAFDPDAFLADEPIEAGGFDPDAFLGEAPAPEITQEAQPIQEVPQNISMFAAPQGAPLSPDAADAMGVSAAQKAYEAIAAIGTGAIAEPVAGIAGIGATIMGGPEEGQKVIEQTREAMTYKPKSQAAKESLIGLGEKVKAAIGAVNYPISGLAGLTELATGQGMEQAGQTIEGIQEEGLGKTLGQRTLEETGSPMLAAGAESLPTAAMELIGLKGLQKVRKGTRLLDDAGQPTKELRKALDKKGLSYDDLTPEAKQSLPTIADPKLLPGADVLPQASEKALIAQIKSGGRSDALAGLKLINGKVGVDTVGKEAMRQGFRPGIVQSIKTSSRASKDKMRRMVEMMRRAKKSERAGLVFRPSDVVGDSVTDRVKFIRDKAKAANKELNQIADSNLKGKPIDISPVVNKLQESLDNLDVRLVDTPSGVPKPIFKGSMISKDKTSQRVINDLVDLMSEGGAPDALRAHKLKRQLDIMIDFNKKSAEGLTEAGKNVLKDIRRQLNDSVRNVDPDYARVNDTLSQTLNAIDSLDDAVGSIDIFGLGANKALGTRMRALLSNQQGRVRIENAVNSLDDVVSNLGGKFDDNIKDLVMFSDAIDDRFGTMAKTSLAGQTEQAVRQAMDQGVARSAFQKGAEIVGKGAEKLRGVNEFNAFESMIDLLNN